MARKPHSNRNTPLARGIGRLSKTQLLYRTGKFLHLKKGDKGKKTAPKPKEEKKKEIVKTFGKKGQTRVIRDKGPRSYPSPDYPTSTMLRRVKKTPQPVRLRASIQPGTVLIILSGPYRGRRVVFLKQLPSGLLLITGPYKINGVPLRRVNQAYVIATKTVVDISSLKIDPKIDDSYFQKEKKTQKAKPEQFFEQEKEPKKVSQARVEAQKSVDTPLTEIIKKTPYLRNYLSALFSLTNGQFPHEMVF